MECKTTNAELWWKRIPELKADKPLRIRRSELMKRRPERGKHWHQPGVSSRNGTIHKMKRRFRIEFE
jgi:hypothetical protein